ncbi:hypothetical protein [Novosphingobium sp. SG720]|uniref:hypothetical protein n=1 Tax=Novosphingobium sp. SG720 TaxID=2586998 RepID=UPI0014484E34|nr:hypothetical protein [Novosphingobium sp. SG720]
MAAVLRDPTQNIFLRPGDLVTLDHEPQSVVMLGATNKQSEVFFGKARLTLAEAIGRPTLMASMSCGTNARISRRACGPPRCPTI